MAGAIPRGERNKMAAVFTHFLAQKFTPLSNCLAVVYDLYGKIVCQAQAKSGPDAWIV